MNLRKFMRTLRQEENLTFKELSSLTGVSALNLHRLENGPTKGQENMIKIIAYLLYKADAKHLAKFEDVLETFKIKQ